MDAWPLPDRLAPQVRGFARQLECQGAPFAGLLRWAAWSPGWCLALGRARALAERDPEARLLLALFGAEVAAVTGHGWPAEYAGPPAPALQAAPAPDLSPSQRLLLSPERPSSVATAVVTCALLATALAPDGFDRLPRRLRVRLAARTVPRRHRARWLDGLSPLDPDRTAAPEAAQLARLVARALPSVDAVAPAPPPAPALAPKAADALLSALAVRLGLRENGVLAPVTAPVEASAGSAAYAEDRVAGPVR